MVNFEFKPSRVNLIVGRNGSGKSTFFEVLYRLKELAAGAAPETVLLPETMPWWESRRRQTFEIEIEDPETKKLFRYRLLVRHAQPTTSIEEESLALGDETLLAVKDRSLRLEGLKEPFPFEPRRTGLSLGIGPDSRTKRFRSLLASVRQFRLNPWSIDAQAMNEQAVVNIDGSNFVGFLRWWSQSEPAQYLRWSQKIGELLPHYQSVKLREVGVGNRILVGVRVVDGVERAVPFFNFSEGERCLAVLYAIAEQASGFGTLALDEPDNFLSPAEIQPLLRTFVELAQENESLQLFVVTHHPESIDYLAPQVTWLFERPNNDVVRAKEMLFDRTKGERASDSVLADLTP